MASRIVPEGGWESRLKPVRTPRVRADQHLRFITRLPCVCCAVEGVVVLADDPMHLRTGSLLHGFDGPGAGEKASDRWTLPGCRRHHDQQHGRNEMAFWRSFGIDPHVLALVLWGLTCDDYAAVRAIMAHAGQARLARRGRSAGVRQPPESV